MRILSNICQNKVQNPELVNTEWILFIVYLIYANFICEIVGGGGGGGGGGGDAYGLL